MGKKNQSDHGIGEQSPQNNQESPNNHRKRTGLEIWVSNLYRKRFSIAMILTLSCWAFVGFVESFRSFLYNAMLLDSYAQLGFVALVNTISVVFAIASMRLLNERVPGNILVRWFGDGKRPWTKAQLLSAVGIAAITPLVLAFGFGSEFPKIWLPHGVASPIAIFLGMMLCWPLFMGVGWLKYFLFGNIDTGVYFPFEFRPDTQAVLEPTEFIGLTKADFQFMAYLFVLICVHWGTARWMSASEVWWSSAPSMVIVLILISGFAFAGVANLLDRFHIPVIPILLVVVTLLQIPSSSSKTIDTVEDNSKEKFGAKIASIIEAENKLINQEPIERKTSRRQLIADETREIDDLIWKAIRTRMSNVKPDGDRGRTLVIVTCPGGGIHAASWAACALERISAEYTDFADSVCVISSVSGGAVGAYYYVAKEFHPQITGTQSAWPMQSFEQGANVPKGIEVGSALDLATRSSLEPIAYGVVTDDLYGAVYSGLSQRDRGQRLEASFQFRLAKEQRNNSLGNWGDVAIEGEMPIVIFNSTDAATGRRVLFDSVPTPRRPSDVGLSSRPINYRELLGPDRDIKPASAVRASATFPYISPFTRPDKASPLGEGMALCDGGYADNEGIVSAVTWLEFILNRWSDDQVNPEIEVPFDRILLLRIQPSPGADLNEPPKRSGFWVWLRWMTGPAETMVKVRATSQSERGNLETDLAKLFSTNFEVRGSGLAADPPRLENPGRVDNQQNAKIMTTFDLPVQQDKNEDAEAFKHRVKSMTQAQSQQAYSNELEAFNRALSKNDDLKQFVPKPSVAPGALPSDRGMMVIDETVPFLSYGQTIPLNWKLSKEQKQWYLRSWFLASDSNSSIRRTLDKYFTRRPVSSGE